MGGRGSGVPPQVTARVLPTDIDVQIDAPPADHTRRHVTLDDPPGGRTRLSPADKPPLGTDAHEIDVGRWLTRRNTGFEWFDKYRKRKSPDAFIGRHSVDFKTLKPKDGLFRFESAAYHVDSGSGQTRRLVLDCRATNLTVSAAETSLRQLVEQFGALLDELVLIVQSEGVATTAVGWHRA